jgi:hypothetical protein
MFWRRKTESHHIGDMNLRPTAYWLSDGHGGKHRANVTFEIEDMNGQFTKRITGSFDECIAFVQKYYFGKDTHGNKE